MLQMAPRYRIPPSRLPPVPYPAQRGGLSQADREVIKLALMAGPPMLPAGYNNNHRIVQTPETVVIFSEMMHDARIIPLDGRPQLADNIRQWSGESRGRWEADWPMI